MEYVKNLKEYLIEKVGCKENNTHLKHEIEIIVGSINNELYKFESNNTGMHLNYASLFVYRPTINWQNNIELAMSKIELINKNYQVDLSKDICDYVYKRLSKIDRSHLKNICGDQTDKIIEIINDRNISNMQILLDNLPASYSKVYKELLQLILQVDPAYQVLKEDDRYKDFFPMAMDSNHPKMQENNLSLESLKPIINFLVKIRNQLFDRENKNDEQNNKINKRM